MKREHVHYFDYLRLLASFCVVYMHVASGPLCNEIDLSWHFTNLFTGLGFIAVPLFFMMSGYLLINDKRTTDIGILLKHRIPHLLVPLLTWSLVMLVLNSYLNDQMNLPYYIQGIISFLHSPAAVHLWFLYTLIAIYAISPFLYGGLQALDRKGHIFVFILITLVSAKAMLQCILPAELDVFLNIDLLNKMSFFDGHLCSFILGYYLGNSKKKIPNSILILLMAITLGIITFGTYYLTMKTGAFNQTFQQQNAGFEVLLAALVFLFAKQNLNKPLRCKLLDIKPFVSLSFGIYFIHIPLILVLGGKYVAHAFHEIVLYSIFLFLVSFLLMKTVATIKPLCFLLTGIPYEKACKSCNWIYTINKQAK